MAYESPIIRSVLGNTIRVSHPVTPNTFLTYLTSSSSSGGTSLSVLDNNGFSQHDFIVIGNFGVDKTEIKQVNAAVSVGTSLTTTSLSYDHAVDSPVLFTQWNQVEISGASSSSGSKTVIATIDIQADRAETTYVNTGTTYAYYFVRFKNSYSSTFSSYSDFAVATGYPAESIRAVKDSALGMVSEKVSPLITEEFLNREILNCEFEVWRAKKKWSWAAIFNYNAGELVEGGYSISLPANISDLYSEGSIQNLHFGSQSNLSYLTKEEWDKYFVDVSHTTLATTFLAGATSIVLTDSSDFDSTGSIMIGSSTYTYSANDTSTNTLTVTATSDGQTAGVDVWQNVTYGQPYHFTVFNQKIYFETPVDSSNAGSNVYFDYYKKPALIVTQTDETDSTVIDLPDPTVIHYYLAWKILLRNANGASSNESEVFRNLYEKQKLLLMQQDRLQRTKWKPRLNMIRNSSSFIVVESNPTSATFP